MPSFGGDRLENGTYVLAHGGCGCALQPHPDKPSAGWIDDDDAVPNRLCCLGGCITATVAAFLFVVIIPGGCILIVYGSNTSSSTFIAVGSVLVLLPLLSVPILVALYLNKRRLKKLRQNQVKNDIAKEVVEARF